MFVFWLFSIVAAILIFVILEFTRKLFKLIFLALKKLLVNMIQFSKRFFNIFFVVLKNFLVSSEFHRIDLIIFYYIKFSLIVICAFLFISNDGTALNMNQFLLFLIWTIAYIIYSLTKSVLNPKFANRYKGVSKIEIFSTYIIRVIYSRIVIMCFIYFLYVSLDGDTFNCIIPWISTTILGVLLNYTDIFGSVSLTPMCHITNAQENPNLYTYANTNLDVSQPQYPYQYLDPNDIEYQYQMAHLDPHQYQPRDQSQYQYQNIYENQSLNVNQNQFTNVNQSGNLSDNQFINLNLNQFVNSNPNQIVSHHGNPTIYRLASPNETTGLDLINTLKSKGLALNLSTYRNLGLDLKINVNELGTSLANYWVNKWGFRLDASYENSSLNLNRVLNVNYNINQITRSSQTNMSVNIVTDGILNENDNDFNHILNTRRHLCNILLSDHAHKVIHEYVMDLERYFPSNKGKHPFIKGTSPYNLNVDWYRTHAITSVYTVYIHYSCMNAWTKSTGGLLKDEWYYDLVFPDGLDTRMRSLIRMDEIQHKFLTNVFKKWNTEILGRHKVYPVIKALAEHINVIEDRSVKYELLSLQNLEKCKDLYKTDQQGVEKIMQQHITDGHLPVYIVGTIPDALFKLKERK